MCGLLKGKPIDIKHGLLYVTKLSINGGIYYLERIETPNNGRGAT